MNTPIECKITRIFIWDSSHVWNRDIDNSFPKKRKYWCIDFTDCTTLHQKVQKHEMVPLNLLYSTSTCVCKKIFALRCLDSNLDTLICHVIYWRVFHDAQNENLHTNQTQLLLLRLVQRSAVLAIGIKSILFKSNLENSSSHKISSNGSHNCALEPRKYANIKEIYRGSMNFPSYS